jgi:hypothetical protein
MPSRSMTRRSCETTVEVVSAQHPLNCGEIHTFELEVDAGCVVVVRCGGRTGGATGTG